MKGKIKMLLSRKPNFISRDYWEERYAAGGNSGDGSYGRLAQFKAEFLNDFIGKNNIVTAVEFGCGDGNQLSLVNYPCYLGLDVSVTAVKKCGEKFRNDSSKSFIKYDNTAFFNKSFINADLTISLDVIYHIIEQEAYEKYVSDLFAASKKYVVIYSTNYDKHETIHVFHRQFTKDVVRLASNFKLVAQSENPFKGNGEQESDANFYVFSCI